MTKQEWYEQVAQCAFIMYGALSAASDDMSANGVEMNEEHRHSGRGIKGEDGRWRLWCDECGKWWIR